MATEAPAHVTERELERILTELRHLQRELVEQRYLRRTDGMRRVGEAVRRLGAVGTASGMIDRAAQELGQSLELDRVLLSRIGDGSLTPVAYWWADGPAVESEALLGRSFTVAYPLVEAEVVQRNEVALVSPGGSGRRLLPEIAAALDVEVFLVAALPIEGKTAGVVHAGRSTGDPPLDETDRELAGMFADGLGQAFERSVLRDTLQRQRAQLRSASQWINAQTLRLAGDELPRGPSYPRPDDAELLDVLTAREREVVRLMARGLSNRSIADSLMLGEGTVKYHVKNILRKLQARSRAEAVSRYMQLEAPREAR